MVHQSTLDFLGNKLIVGDAVVFVQLGYRNLLCGKIKSISTTGKTVIISHAETNTCSTETKQSPSQVVKTAKFNPLSVLRNGE